ncbi:carbohydrate-binding module family 50 protein [Piromyces sp. E2]|nr:carbohydrate-binding module family 50 protein [Piromyces sp. E2]|eukprot:OUM57197.1 carbohydrate-binding module family 50 protein [Piromyces sp. E2]
MKSFKVTQILLALIPFTLASNFDCDQFYTVQNDDYCYGISAGNSISLTKLKILNPEIDCENLTPGDSLCVKADLHYSDYINFVSVDDSMKKRSNTNDVVDTDDIVDQYTETKEKVNDAMDRLFPDAEEAEEFKTNSEYAISGFVDAMSYSETDDIKNIDTEECKARCSVALSQFEDVVNDPSNNFNLESYNNVLQESDQDTIDSNYFYNLCVNQCYLLEEFKEAYDGDNVADKN